MTYTLETVQKVYSYWGRSRFAYSMGVSFFGMDRHLRKRAVELLALKKGNAVVDLACGPGNMLSLLEKAVGTKGSIIAVDYVAEMTGNALALARGKGWANVSVVRCDAARLNLDSNSADAVLCVLGFSAIPDHKSALVQAKRILKKGGRLVVLDGKDFRVAWLNPMLKLIRWSKSYQRKDILADQKMVFGNIAVEESFLGSTFIAVSIKK